MVLLGRKAQRYREACVARDPGALALRNHHQPAAAILGCDCREVIKTRVTCPPRREWHNREQTNGKVSGLLVCPGCLVGTG